jgi:hypothetical protein
MAAPKSKAQPVGSSQWIQSERQQASDFISQEVEEFGYSARNELEWLNEHMADVFSTTRVFVEDYTAAFVEIALIILSQELRGRFQNTWQAKREDTTHSSKARCVGTSTAACRYIRSFSSTNKRLAAKADYF